MDDFYTTVLIVALVILILLLTYTGVILYYAKREEVYPPRQAKCPDYWVINPDDGKCVLPSGTNAKNRGTIAIDEINNWKVDTNDSINSRTRNLINIDSNNKKSLYDMADGKWSSNYGKTTTICNKKAWANTVGVAWDGVSNYNNC